MEMIEAKKWYFSGLDLGQAQDFTALAVIEKSLLADPERPRTKIGYYAVRHLERFPLGTPYTEVCARLAELFRAQPMSGSTLAVDQTGVGRPVIDLLRGSPLKAKLCPITITGGHKATPDDRGGWLVPKKELVSTLQVLLQARRLKVADALPEAATLVQELMTFQVKITPAANEVFGVWREGQHDDLVLAVAVACWIGERHQPMRGCLPSVVPYDPSRFWRT
jgi:hypothetical protein